MKKNLLSFLWTDNNIQTPLNVLKLLSEAKKYNLKHKGKATILLVAECVIKKSTKINCH